MRFFILLAVVPGLLCAQSAAVPYNPNTGNLSANLTLGPTRVITLSGGSIANLTISTANITAPGNSTTLLSSAFGNVTIGANLTLSNGTLSSTGGGVATTNASLLTSGTLADARLSGNVVITAANNTFTGANAFSNAITLNGTANSTITGNAIKGFDDRGSFAARLYRTQAAMQATIGAQNGTRLRVLEVGDSWRINLYRQFYKQFGFLGEGQPTYTLEGTATVNYSWTISPRFEYYTLANGTGNVSFFGRNGTVATKIFVPYRTQAGGGNFAIDTRTVDSFGNSSWTTEGNYSCDSGNATMQGANVTITKAYAAPYHVRVRSLNGTCLVREPMISFNPLPQQGDRSGVLIGSVGWGGTDADGWEQTPQQILTNDMSFLNPNIMLIRVAPGDYAGANWTASMIVYLDKLRIACPNADMVFIGSHPTYDLPDPYDDGGYVDAGFRALSDKYGGTFLDVRRYFPSHPEMVTANLSGALNVHLSNAGNFFLENVVWTLLRPLLTPGGGTYGERNGTNRLEMLQNVGGSVYRDATPPVWKIVGNLQQGAVGTIDIADIGLANSESNYHAGNSAWRLSAGTASWTMGVGGGTSHVYAKNTFPRWWFTPYSYTRTPTARLEITQEGAEGSNAAVVIGGAPGATGAMLELRTGANGTVTGNLVMRVTNNGTLSFNGTGTSGRVGNFTLSSGNATVSNTAVTANSSVFFTLQTPSGTVDQHPYASSIVAGANFTVTATASDNSTYSFLIIDRF